VSNTTNKKAKYGAGMAGINALDMNGDPADYIYLLKGGNTNEFWRYNTATDAWEKLADIPTSPVNSGTRFRDGSCLVSDGKHTLYAMKSFKNELYSYDVNTSGPWVKNPDLPALPRPGACPWPGVPNQNKDVKSGGSIAYLNNALYAVKGNNCVQFWRYDPANPGWEQRDDVPILPTALNKRVRHGSALTAARGMLFALKGNKTQEFYRYIPHIPAFKDEGRMAGQQRPSAMPTLSIAPNPSRLVTTVSYSLPEVGRASLRLYDITGKLVLTLAGGSVSTGCHATSVDAASLASGVYVVKFVTESTTLTKKLVIE
jgi:hypothetical protein